ncbi:MAG: hypothetical protein WBD16_01195 [Pyrinomonadaceae bacterium]
MMATTHIKETHSANLPDPSPITRKGLRKTLLTPFVCSILASIGIFGGMSALFAGIMCVVIHAVLLHDTIFDQVGTILLCAAIPMILVGSIFLDEIEGKR